MEMMQNYARLLNSAKWLEGGKKLCLDNIEVSEPFVLVFLQDFLHVAFLLSTLKKLHF